MTTGAANKRKGAAYEIALVDHFREAKFDTERLRLSGKEDEGDIVVRAGGRRVIVEAKSGTNVRPRHWFDEEAVPEARNYSKRRDLTEDAMPVLSMKSHNKAIGKSLVVITLDEFTELLRKGYGDG